MGVEARGGCVVILWGLHVGEGCVVEVALGVGSAGMMGLWSGVAAMWGGWQLIG